MKRKDEWDEWQESFSFLRKTDLSQAPSAKPQEIKSPKRVSARTRNQRFRQKARMFFEKDFIAPAGFEQEKQLLMRWAKQAGLNVVERKMIQDAIDSPDVPARRDALFWLTAKRRFMGEYSFDAAKERHKRLNSGEWLVAYLTSQGVAQKRIAGLTRMSERMVDQTMASLKLKIAIDLDCDTVGIARITRWFIGS
jgi:hypothetical protein